MGKKVRWSQELKEVVFEMISKGATLTAMQKRTGRCRATIKKLLKAKGLRLHNEYGRYSKEQVSEMIHQYVGGDTTNVIGKRFGCTPANVYGFVVRAGIVPRTRHEASGNRSHGPESGQWRGGRYGNGKGYVCLTIYGRGKKNRELEHRYVMECHLKKVAPHHPAIQSGQLSKRWHVHHINKIKSDNRIENLMLLDSGDHRRVHAGDALYLTQANHRILGLESRVAELEELVTELKSQSVYCV